MKIPAYKKNDREAFFRLDKLEYGVYQIRRKETNKQNRKKIK